MNSCLYVLQTNVPVYTIGFVCCLGGGAFHVLVLVYHTAEMSNKRRRKKIRQKYIYLDLKS